MIIWGYCKETNQFLGLSAKRLHLIIFHSRICFSSTTGTVHQFQFQQQHKNKSWQFGFDSNGGAADGEKRMWSHIPVLLSLSVQSSDYGHFVAPEARNTLSPGVFARVHMFLCLFDLRTSVYQPFKKNRALQKALKKVHPSNNNRQQHSVSSVFICNLTTQVTSFSLSLVRRLHQYNTVTEALNAATI